jgi:hypothetical protein
MEGDEARGPYERRKEGKAGDGDGDGDGGVREQGGIEREGERGRESAERAQRQTPRETGETGQEVGARPAASGKAGPPC